MLERICVETHIPGYSSSIILPFHNGKMKHDKKRNFSDNIPSFVFYSYDGNTKKAID